MDILLAELFTKIIFISIVVVWIGLITFIVLVCSKLFSDNYKKQILITGLLVTIVIWAPLWKVFPGKIIAKNECDDKGGLTNFNPIYVDGFLMKDSDSSYDLIGIAKLLLTDGYKFIERNAEGYNGFANRFRGYGESYLLYYIDTIDSDACEPFLDKVKSGSDIQSTLRRMGLKPEQCIAVKHHSPLKSDYGFHAFSENRGFPSFINWKSFQIINFKNGDVHSEFKYFFYNTFIDKYFFYNKFIEKIKCWNKDDYNYLVKNIIKPKSNESLDSVFREELVFELNFIKHQPSLKFIEARKGNKQPTNFSLLTNTNKNNGDISMIGSTLYWINNGIKKKIDLSDYAYNSYESQVFVINNNELYILTQKNKNRALIKLNWNINDAEVYPFVLPGYKKEGGMGKAVVESINQIGNDYELVFLDSKENFHLHRKYVYKLEVH